MFSKEANDFAEYIKLTQKVVRDSTATKLLYHAYINFEQFLESKEKLYQSLFKLNGLKFARSQGDHMTNGIFVDLKYTSEMEATKVQVLRYLTSSVIAGYRYIRCIKSARSCEGNDSTDWKIIRKDISFLENDFRLARNALEHIEEILYNSQIAEEKWYVHEDGIFFYENNSIEQRFIFFDSDNSSFSRLQELHDKFLKMLRQR